ncbi:hypothetical protein [Geoglobus acetivorans]|uniref:Uncharacterized protein n=1 Tax=Geoglobus acetivorans TaxID=565033 RepID=A0A0A7GHH8_GEOAI|nr:hypothetical protein GACE_1361 [Geoglobus acetivorans]
MKRRIVILLALFVLGVLVLGCAQQEEAKTTPTPAKTVEKTPTPKPKEEKTPKPTPTPEKKSTPTPTPTPKKVEASSPLVECTVCHTKSTDYKPHVNGGQYCANCHGSNPHTIHVGPGTINLECSVCHGPPDNIQIPKPIEEGRTVCENCHAYPDATKPSYGNLVNIHLPRGKYCTVCHGTDVSGLHTAADSFVE